MTNLLVLMLIPCAMLACAYLAACAGAGRWLSWSEWWGGDRG